MIMSNFTIIPREEMPTVVDVFNLLQTDKIEGLIFKFPNGTVITNDAGGFRYSEDIIRSTMINFFKDYHVDAVQMTNEGIFTFHILSNVPPAVMKSFWTTATNAVEVELEDDKYED